MLLFLRQIFDKVMSLIKVKFNKKLNLKVKYKLNLIIVQSSKEHFWLHSTQLNALYLMNWTMIKFDFNILQIHIVQRRFCHLIMYLFSYYFN